MPIMPDYNVSYSLSNCYGSPDRLTNVMSSHIANRCLQNLKDHGKTKNDGVIVQCNALSLDLALSSKMPIHLNATYGPAGALFYAARDRSSDLVDKINFFINSKAERKFEQMRQLLIDYEDLINSGKTLMEVEMIAAAALYAIVAEWGARLDDEAYTGELFNLGKVDMLTWNQKEDFKITHEYAQRGMQRLKGMTISTLPIEMLLFRTVADLTKEGKKGYFVFDFPILSNAFTQEEFQFFVKDMLTLLILKEHQPLLYCWNRPENVAFLKACGVNIVVKDGEERIVQGSYYLGRRDRVPLHVAEVKGHEQFIQIS